MLDLSGFLRTKLDFIRNLDVKSTEPFNSTIRKINEHEAPFDGYDGDPECAEDPFLDEWFNAYYSIETLGSCCLCLVHDTLKQFLDEFITSTGRKVPAGKGSWIHRYREFFLSEYNIDWDAAPLDMSIVEQIALARNQLQHSGELMADHVWQSADHKAKAPQSIFTEDVGRPENKLSVKKDSLFRAIEFVNSFGRFLLSGTTETIKIGYVSPFDAFERIDDAAALELLKQELDE
jgi:hypothetical protein